MKHSDTVNDLCVEKWQIKLLTLNPEYSMLGTNQNISSSHNSWKEFIIFDMQKSNGIFDFYFEINRHTVECNQCINSSGYSVKSQLLEDSWNSTENNSFSFNLEQPEIDYLYNNGRLGEFNECPDPETFNNAVKYKRYIHDDINKYLCIKSKSERLSFDMYCNNCSGDGYTYTNHRAYTSLRLMTICPRTSYSSILKINNIQRSELPEIFRYLNLAASRNQMRFNKIKELV